MPEAPPGAFAWADAAWAEAGTGEALAGRWGGGRVPLRVLTRLRWVAIAGQAAAIAAALRLGFDLPLGPASVAVGASAVVNLVAALVPPRGRRLTDGEAQALLGFDLVQLASLLSLTGGLDNPFAVLLLAPAAVAATVLPTGRALALGALALGLLAALGLWHLPLRGPAGPVEPPAVIRLGFGLALAIGIAFLGLYARAVTAEAAAMAEALAATRMALAREQRLTDLGGVVAAAAHELGTPLATIALASGELARDLARRPDLPSDLLDDARLIRAQADRCRDILRGLGRAGQRDPVLDRVPAEVVLREAASPHMGRGKAVTVMAPPGRQPHLPRRPEIVHGLRNLVQNAVDFAAAEATLRLHWDAERLEIRIGDDGPGFAPAALGRVGDPFLRHGSDRLPPGAGRPGYEGMGLGLFIAKTLLERTGARLTFANAPGGGAVVGVSWPRALLADPPAAPPPPRGTPLTPD